MFVTSSLFHSYSNFNVITMPKLNPPSTLEDLAIRRLAAHCCEHCIISDAIETWCEFRCTTEAIRNYLVSILPMQFFRRFEVAVLERMQYSPGTYKHTVARVKMLVNYGGFPGKFMSFLDPRNAEIITKMSSTQRKSKWAMTRYVYITGLKHLTIFEMYKKCNDTFITTIAKHCPALRVVDISNSKEVTDVGLCALAYCTNLRRARYTLCSVTIQGIERLISVNGKIEGIFAWTHIRGCRLRDASVHPGIRSLELSEYEPMQEDLNELLRCVVRKFPNLETFILDVSNLCEDLSVLSGLEQLSNLKICLHRRWHFSEDWRHLGSLLSSIGADLKTLVLPIVRQSELDLIYEHCPNLKYLEFIICSLDRDDSGLPPTNKIVIPPFRNLTQLRYTCQMIPSGIAVEFMRMPQLTQLWHSGDDIEKLDSLMVDHERFPNLSHIMIPRGSQTFSAINRLKRIAKTRNLDLGINELGWTDALIELVEEL